MLKNTQMDAWDRENFFYPSTHLAEFARGNAPQRIVTGGEGVYITDADGDRLLDGFSGLCCVNVGEVQGEGMLCAVEMVEDKASRKFFDPARKVAPAIASSLLKRNVIARAMPQSDVVGFAPPLCLTRAEADIIVGAMVEAVGEVFPQA